MAETVNPDQQTVQQTPEAGIRFDRCWFLREEVAGQIPADPAWDVYSDLMLNFEASVDPGNERVDGLGSADPVTFNKTSEEIEITVAYGLQRPIVDVNGDPLDPVADAFLRNEAWQIPNTHALVARDNNPSKGPDDAADVQGQRQYLVMKGGKADASIEPDVEDAEPTPVELTYMAEKARSYHIWQPADTASLAVDSTSANDTTQTVTIEDEGGATSITLTLDGTNLVGDTTLFGDIDAIHLSDETEGDVTVYINDGDATTPVAGSELATIHGASFYATDAGTLEGDLGVPALGAGTAPSPINEPYEDFLGDRVERPTGASIAPTLNNITVEVDNNLDTQARQNTQRMRIVEEGRDITMDADVQGEKSSHDLLEDALGNNGLDMDWELSRTLFEFPSATVTDPPSRAREPVEGVSEVSVTLESIGARLINTA